jgi:hypothetical protein
LIPELVQHSLDELLQVWAPWHRPKGTENTYSYINILAKTLCAVHTTEFRPVVVVRLLHTTLCTFAYTILGRVESTLKKKNCNLRNMAVRCLRNITRLKTFWRWQTFPW